MFIYYKAKDLYIQAGGMHDESDDLLLRLSELAELRKTTTQLQKDITREIKNLRRRLVKEDK